MTWFKAPSFFLCWSVSAEHFSRIHIVCTSKYTTKKANYGCTNAAHWLYFLVVFTAHEHKHIPFVQIQFTDNEWKTLGLFARCIWQYSLLNISMCALFIWCIWSTLLQVSTRHKAPYTYANQMRMCGWDCKHVLYYLQQMVYIPFTANQNLSDFCSNTKEIGCAGCPVFTSGLRKINLPRN